jgi:6-phosphofructokinase 1
MSKIDIEESQELGAYAVKYAVEGISGQMSSLVRKDTEDYQVEYTSVDIKQVANMEKKVPVEWINEEGNGVKEDMIKYLKPLVQGEISNIYVDGVPQYMLLK